MITALFRELRKLWYIAQQNHCCQACAYCQIWDWKSIFTLEQATDKYGTYLYGNYDYDIVVGLLKDMKIEYNWSWDEGSAIYVKFL